MVGRRVIACLALAISLAACADDADGVGFLTVADFDDDPELSYLLAERPVSVEATLRVQKSGCVDVVVDDTVYVPAWPRGTEVKQVEGDLSTYEVTFADGTKLVGTLDADNSTFTADAVLGSAPIDLSPGGKVVMGHDYCDPSAPYAVITDVDVETDLDPGAT